MPVDSLVAADSPRLGGLSREHVEVLAQRDIEPILVHRGTRRVIDGMHRLQAAGLRGERMIPVRFLDGPVGEIFIRSVVANVAHGLPLTLKDRKAAAGRILISHPDLSDRAIARITGLSPKTVGVVRRASTEEVPQSKVRVGADGRSRPLDAARRREAARAFLAEHAGATLHEIAASAGVSISTACEIRQRVRRGEQNEQDPSPPRTRPARGARDRNRAASIGPPAGDQRAEGARAQRIETLAKDPSLRFTESGRALLRWLNERAPDLEAGRQLMSAVPLHCAVAVADLANSYAQEWQRFASALDQALGDAGEQ
ncbi:ParB/RepB/Spo0J family partition protein [Streptomyces sp. UNOC14_S4]|uniref:ParB/RepB/Spo0J family partition protein n=1 Tax=Streptomyces sp. UNOC14_S4 TaxID=2872340 RepID=UPI001E5C5A66|nr:ParB/RepB/Spo0J family partition protein [Streptomyces sp. UNOC14_S4]